MATTHGARTDLPIWTPKPDAPVWARARGEHVTAADGREFIDLSMGWGACLWGHGLIYERIIDRYDPAELAQGVGSSQTTVLRQRAETALVHWAQQVWPGSPELRVGILHTGAEAVETAIKTAIAATGRSEVVAFKGAYHGSFGAAVAASDDPDTRRAFAPTLEFSNLRHEPYGEVPELSEQTACVIVEPIQGATGVVVPPDGFLDELRAECDRVGALLILDDVLAGCGRSGAPIEGVACGPDVVVLAKALGGGMVCAAVVMPETVARAAWAGDNAPSLSTTYYGHPLSCAAILEVLELHAAHDLQELCRPIEDALRNVEARTSLLLRGRGAFWALVGTKGEGAALSEQLLEHGIIVDGGGEHGEALSLKPSLLMEPDSWDRTCAAIIHCAGRT
ncbi:MAG: rocD2 [Thermoleophilia bacterium]|nr:rocD2 [Thermoleophilia bacterium]